jgi:hypothetical protein
VPIRTAFRKGDSALVSDKRKSGNYNDNEAEKYEKYGWVHGLTDFERWS